MRENLSTEFGDNTYLKSWVLKYATEYGGKGGLRSPTAMFYRLAYEYTKMIALDEGKGSSIWHELQELKTVDLENNYEKADEIFEIVFGGIDPKSGQGSHIRDKLLKMSKCINSRILPYLYTENAQQNDLFRLSLRHLECPEQIVDIAMSNLIWFNFPGKSEVYLAKIIDMYGDVRVLSNPREQLFQAIENPDTNVSEILAILAQMPPEAPATEDEKGRQLLKLSRTVPVEEDTLKARAIHVVVPYSDPKDHDFSTNVAVKPYWYAMPANLDSKNGILILALEALITRVRYPDTVAYERDSVVVNISSINPERILRVDLSPMNIHRIYQGILEGDKTSTYKISTTITGNGRRTVNASFLKLPNDTTSIPTWPMNRVVHNGNGYEYTTSNKIKKGDEITLQVPVSGSYALPWPDSLGNTVYSYAVFLTIEPEKPHGYTPKIEIGPITPLWESVDTTKQTAFEYNRMGIKGSIKKCVNLKSPTANTLIDVNIEIPEKSQRGRNVIKAHGFSYDYKARTVRETHEDEWRCFIE